MSAGDDSRGTAAEDERLEAGESLRIADFGCGEGWASIYIAEAYPKRAVRNPCRYRYSTIVNVALFGPPSVVTNEAVKT